MPIYGINSMAVRQIIVKFRTWMCNYIPHETIKVISYSYSNRSYPLLTKKSQIHTENMNITWSENIKPSNHVGSHYPGRINTCWQTMTGNDSMANTNNPLRLRGSTSSSEYNSIIISCLKWFRKSELSVYDIGLPNQFLYWQHVRLLSFYGVRYRIHNLILETSQLTKIHINIDMTRQDIFATWLGGDILHPLNKKRLSTSAVDITEIFRRSKRVLDVHSVSIILLHFISRLVYCYGYVVRYVVHAFKLTS